METVVGKRYVPIALVSVSLFLIKKEKAMFLLMWVLFLGRPKKEEELLWKLMAKWQKSGI